MQRKPIVLIDVTIEIKEGKTWKQKTIKIVVSRGGDKQEIIKNISPYRLFEKGKIKEYKVKNISVLKQVGLTNYLE